MTSLPYLNENLGKIDISHNPISEFIGENIVLNNIKTKIQIVNNFCHLYYAIKFKKQFRYLLWEKIREPKIMKKYHPSYLIENLHETTDLDELLNNW